MEEIRVEVYETNTGKKPFEEWLKKNRDTRIPTKVLIQLNRLKLGNFGNWKALGDGLCELKIHYGPGIRIYYSKIGEKVVLLLCGGDKGSQTKDIHKAKEYLRDYLSR